LDELVRAAIHDMEEATGLDTDPENHDENRDHHRDFLPMQRLEVFVFFLIQFT
jgi:hypothetical protein